MEDILVNFVNVIVGMAIGSVSGYAYAYFSGLQAMRKGMQLILRGFLNDMYIRFQNAAPTPEEKLIWQEMYSVYEHLAENGIMKAKYEAVLHMAEDVRK